MPRAQRKKILDFTQKRIEVFNEANGGGVSVHKDAHGYTLNREDTGVPVARLRPIGSTGLVEILWWSWRNRWESIGDFGGVRLPLEEALDYIAEDPMNCFWH